MDEQDHADLILKQRRAIREVMPNATAEEVERLVGALAEIREEVAAVFARYRQRSLSDCAKDLSEFVRGIVHGELYPPQGSPTEWRIKYDRCTCAWIDGKRAPRLDPALHVQCRVPGHSGIIPTEPANVNPRCTCPWSTTAPLSQDCPVHGVARTQPTPLDYGRGGDPYFRR